MTAKLVVYDSATKSLLPASYDAGNQRLNVKGRPIALKRDVLKVGETSTIRSPFYASSRPDVKGRVLGGLCDSAIEIGNKADANYVALSIRELNAGATLGSYEKAGQPVAFGSCRRGFNSLGRISQRRSAAAVLEAKVAGFVLKSDAESSGAYASSDAVYGSGSEEETTVNGTSWGEFNRRFGCADRIIEANPFLVDLVDSVPPHEWMTALNAFGAGFSKESIRLARTLTDKAA